VWGGVVLHDLGLPFNSPTVNLYFSANDFVKFLSKLNYYLHCEFEEVKDSGKEYPVGRLDDLVVHFVHYQSFEEAVKKWKERCNRIDFEHIYTILVDRDGCNELIAKKYDSLPYRNKVFLTYKDYPHIKSLVYLKNSEDNGKLRDICQYKSKLTRKRWLDDFNYVEFFNRN